MGRRERQPLVDRIAGIFGRTVNHEGDDIQARDVPRPDLGQWGVPGDARFAPLLVSADFDKSKRQWVLGHRLDRISYRDYDSVRFYPTVRDALQAVILPIERANFHFECSDQVVADLAMQELGPHIRGLMRNLAKGGMEWGRQTVEKVWMLKEDISVSTTQSDTGAVEMFYPFIWTIKRFATFSPDDTELLIWPGTGEFAGIRQFVSVAGYNRRDIPASKLIHWVHEPEFDSNYGVPRTKASIPFVDLATNLYGDAGIYFNRYAVPTLIGYAPIGMRAQGKNPDGTPIMRDNKRWMADQLTKLRNATSLVFSNEMVPDSKGGSAGRAWSIEPLEIGERGMFVEFALHLNVMIGASLCVPQMALSTVPSSGTYNLGQTQIDLFTQNIEAQLDSLRDAINTQLCDDFALFNYGAKCPPLRLVIEPVSTDVARQMLQGLIQNLSMGVPITLPTGEQIIPDWAKVCNNYGVPIIKVGVEQQAQMMQKQAAMERDAQAIMGPQPGQGGAPPQQGAGDPSQGDQPPMQESGEDQASAHGKRGGAVQDATGDGEAANKLPGTNGGMSGIAAGKEERGRAGLSENGPEGYRSGAELMLLEELARSEDLGRGQQ